MRSQREWLRRVLRVPYVPTLGLHPDTLCPELFDDVLAASRTGQALPFDKDRRWSQRKDHALLAEEIIDRPDRTIIPTLSRRNGGLWGSCRASDLVRPSGPATCGELVYAAANPDPVLCHRIRPGD